MTTKLPPEHRESVLQLVDLVLKMSAGENVDDYVDSLDKDTLITMLISSLGIFIGLLDSMGIDAVVTMKKVGLLVEIESIDEKGV